MQWNAPKGQAPPGAVLAGYVVEQQIGANAWTRLIKTDAKTLRFATEPLEPQKTYAWRVKALYAKGSQTLESAYADSGAVPACLQVAAENPDLKLLAKADCGKNCISLLWNGDVTIHTIRRWDCANPVGPFSNHDVLGSSTNDLSVEAGKSYGYTVTVAGADTWSNTQCVVSQ